MLSKRALFGFVFLIILSLSTAFGAVIDLEVETDGTFTDACGDEDYIILEMESRTNSHAQFFGEPDNYAFKLCYPSSDTLEVIGLPADSGDFSSLVRECRGRNQISSLFDRTNSHVESPEIGAYSQSMCYGFFENCRAESYNYPIQDTLGEVALFWMSENTNAHIADIDENVNSGGDIAYEYKMVCEVPYCGNNQLGEMYPILLDFENEGPGFTDEQGDFKAHNFIKSIPEPVELDPPTFTPFDVDNLQIYQGWFNYIGAATANKITFDGVYDASGTYYPDFEISLSNGQNVWIYSDYAFFDQDPLGVDGASERSQDSYYYLFNGVEVLLVNGFFEYNGIAYYVDRSWAALDDVTLGDVEQVFREDALTPSGDSSGASISIHTTDVITGNNAIKIDLGMNQNRGESRITLYDLYKTDWSEFDNLEFYLIPLTAGSLKIDIELIEPDGTLVSQVYDVSAHAPTKFENDKPSLIRLPINQIGDWSQVASISFYIDNTTANFAHGNTYSFILDTFVLRSDNPENEFEEFYYCNGRTGFYEWSDNLDPINPGAVAVVSLEACTSSDLYENGVIFTTPTRCCGEELGEVYADGTQGCYDGSVVEDGDVFDYVTYRVNGEQFTSFCGSESCQYAMPVVPIDDVINPGARFAISNVPVGVNMEFEQSNSLESNFIDDELIINITQPRYAYGQVKTVTGPVGNRIYDVTAEEDNTFRVCGTSSTADFIGDNSLITSENTCSVVGDYYCTPGGFWSDDNSNVRGEFLTETVIDAPLPASNRSKLSDDFNAGQPQGCCPENSCWHDGQCWADQSDIASVGVVFDGAYTTTASAGKRCIAGNWEDQIQKPGLVRGDYGFCADESQCLVSSIPRPADGVVNNCIDSGEYFQDYYCNDGEWSTRTILVANELSELADTGEYRLYCDTFDRISNLAGSTNTNSGTYETLFSGAASTVGFGVASNCDVQFSSDDETCVNNICVLVDENDNVFFGTSFNSNLRGPNAGVYTTPESVFNDIDATLALDCSGVTDGRCADDKDGSWYYNNETRIILFSPKNDNIFTDFFSAVGNVISDVFNFINPFTSAIPSDLVPSQDIIQTLYRLEGNGALQIAAFRIEENQNRDAEVATYVVRYAGASSSTVDAVCNGLQTYADANQAQGGEPITVDCQTDTILVNSSSLQSSDVWSRITVALRQ